MREAWTSDRIAELQSRLAEITPYSDDEGDVGWDFWTQEDVKDFQNALREIQAQQAELARLREENERLERESIDLEKKRRLAVVEQGFRAALLADICEAMFGDNTHGAPYYLSYEHASWICGPLDKAPSLTWLEQWAVLQMCTLNSSDLEGWKQFLAKTRNAARGTK